jgi:FdhE protein
MPLSHASGPGPQDIAQALETLAGQTPALAPVLGAFGPLLIAQAALREALPALDRPLPVPPAAGTAQETPLAGVGDFLEIEGLDLADYLRRAALALLPLMAQGFPALAGQTALLSRALEQGRLPAARALEALLGGQAQELTLQAQALDMEPAALEFCLGQLAKPLIEQRALALAPLLEGRAWGQGLCPICGSLPEMIILRGEGGQRWLRCSLCAHQWRVDRTTCPVCGNQDQDQMRFMFADDQPRQRADLCHACGKYLVTLDIRDDGQEPVWATAALGLLHLDILAQGQGLSPAARTAWNRLD